MFSFFGYSELSLFFAFLGGGNLASL